MSKVILSVLFLIFILGTLVSLTIDSSAESNGNGNGKKDNALLICDNKGSSDTMTVKRLSPSGLQSEACNIGDDCALCLDGLSVDGFTLIEMRKAGKGKDANPDNWLWGFWLRADANGGM